MGFSGAEVIEVADSAETLDHFIDIAGAGGAALEPPAQFRRCQSPPRQRFDSVLEQRFGGEKLGPSHHEPFYRYGKHGKRARRRP